MELKVLNREIAVVAVSKRSHQRQPTYIRAWREKLGLRQNALAERMGFNPGSVNRLETGQSLYDQRSLELAADALGLHPADLLLFDPIRDYKLRRIVKMLRDASETTRVQAEAILTALIESQK